MRYRKLALFLTILMIAPVFLITKTPVSFAQKSTPDVYFGIDIAYDDIAATKQLIDNVCSYTNLFGIGCTGISYDTRKLTEICQYLFDRDMFFIIYTGSPRQPPRDWLDAAKGNWGNSFLGLYVDDEIGGKQLDHTKDYTTVTKAANYSDAANQFTYWVSWYLSMYSSHSGSIPMFTSDYGLYWFDYESGYDTIFAEFGWNYSRQLNIALCRGAATMQNKDWGAIITYTYTTPPYIESGNQLYKDMILAYDNGAKYILVFDTDETYSHTILGEEHLLALKQFYQYIQNNPRRINTIEGRVAYALPKDYAYGFRGPNDKIWGLWENDSIRYDISVATSIMLQEYGPMLDIVYEDAFKDGNTSGYHDVIYWNDPAPVQDLWPDAVIPHPFLTPNLNMESPASTFSALSPNPFSNQSTPNQSTQNLDPQGIFSLPTSFALVVTALLAAVLGGVILILRRNRAKQKIKRSPK
jgi:hypothetical protein